MHILVQILLGLHYPQYEDHPATTPTKTITNFKSHPPFGLLSKKRTENPFGEFLRRKFYSLGDDSGLRKNSLDGNSGLRKFQKATNSLRKNNIDESKVIEEFDRINDCQIPRKNELEGHMRHFWEHPINDNDDDLKTLDRKIEHLIRLRTFRKFQQILDRVISDDYTDSRMDGTQIHTNTENVKRRINDDLSETSESSEEDKDNEGSVADVTIRK